MAKHLILGEEGEKIAEEFLRRLGYTIVDRRVRCRHGELDLVARFKKEWVFVEVKTRSNDRMGTAVQAVTRTKLSRLKKAIVEYVYHHDLGRERMRCDLVAIDLDREGKPVITHYPGGIDLAAIR